MEGKYEKEHLEAAVILGSGVCAGGGDGGRGNADPGKGKDDH